MGNTWRILIVIGVVSLLAVVGWEFFQIASGGRTSFSLTVNEMNRSNLISDSVESHIRNDTEFQFQVISFPTNP